MPEYDGIRCIFCGAPASVPKKPEKTNEDWECKNGHFFSIPETDVRCKALY